MMFAGGSLINWDLQTGGPLGTIFPDWKIPDMKPFSFTHSEDGKAVAVAYKTNYSAKGCPTYIYTYNLLSMTYIRYQHASSEQVIYPIWSHDGCYHYATISPVLGIRIWKSPFISEYPRTKEVKSLPIPNEIVDGSNFLFLPALSRLAFTLKDSIQIWDAKASKLLLKSKFTPTWLPDMRYPPRSSFSSDGHFFASASATREVYVWRESPTGYVFHQQLPFLTSPFPSPGPQLSPNGKSIIIAANSKIHQLQTRNHILSLPSFSTQGTYQHHFILEFFPNEKFAAFVRWKGNMVTILDLQSGEQRWITDMGVQSDCLGITGSTVIVVGEGKIVAWNLPGQDNTNISIHDSIQTTILKDLPSPHDLGDPMYMSISPDLSYIMVMRAPTPLSGYTLELDDVSTGRCLAKIQIHNALRPQFTQDKHVVWARNCDSFGEYCEIVGDSISGTVELKLQTTQGPSRILFQESPHGHNVTDYGWVLSPTGKQLLWLPHHWRSDEWYRTWGGQFLGLSHCDLSDVVILEFFE